MVGKNLAAFAALLSATLVAGQTKSACDPTTGAVCPPDKAFGIEGCTTKVNEFDFTTVPGPDGWRKDSRFNDWWIPDAGVLGESSPLSTTSDGGMVLSITNPDQAPLVKSSHYLFFGKVEVTMKPSPGVGIITSIVLESDDRDEIDWEWLGGVTNKVQTNFFSKGVNEFTRGRTHDLSFSAMDSFHTYGVEWTADFISFTIDGVEVRRATPAEADGGAKWPQTPCMLKLGSWVAGKPSLPQGTIDWAGGLADFSNAPFVAAYKSVKITDYCGGKEKAAEYVYGDTSGSAASIVVRPQLSVGESNLGQSSPGSGLGFGNTTTSSTSSVLTTTTANSTTTATTLSTTVTLPSTTTTATEEADDEATQSSTDSAPTETQTGSPSAGSVKTFSSTLAGLLLIGYLLQ